MKPRGSLLGLDKLAAAKKKEKLEMNKKAEEEPEQPSSKRSKTFSYTTGEEEVLDSNTPSHRRSSREDDEQNDIKDKNRKYRDRDYVDDRKTPTPHRSYHDKISRDGHNSSGSSSKKGVYASTFNKSN